MTTFAFDPPPLVSVPVAGVSERFPVHRIYCVGVNYAKHGSEMGRDLREPPCFFTKFVDALVPGGGEVPYPPGTQNYHHEVELVVAIGREGREIANERAREHVFGYAVGLDMTRRDLQANAVSKRLPWDVAKSFDQAAPISAIQPSRIAPANDARIWLEVNGDTRQSARLSEMIWDVPGIVAELSKLYRLMPGDLIFSGTPEGVGPVVRGDRIRAGVEGIANIEVVIV